METPTNDEQPQSRRFERKFLLGALAGSLVTIIVFAGIAVAGASAINTFEEQEIENIPLGGISVTDEEARNIVLEANPGATVRDVELESKNGVIAYEIKLSNGAEIGVDAATGAILGAEQADDDNSENDDGEDDD
jgi:hypothetical protein